MIRYFFATAGAVITPLSSAGYVRRRQSLLPARQRSRKAARFSPQTAALRNWTILPQSRCLHKRFSIGSRIAPSFFPDSRLELLPAKTLVQGLHLEPIPLIEGKLQGGERKERHLPWRSERCFRQPLVSNSRPRAPCRGIPHVSGRRLGLRRANG
jgi:hypothetical protein